MAVEKSLPDKYGHFNEWYNEIVARAKLVDIRFGVKGFIVYRPAIMYIINRIYDVYERELQATGHEPCLFPVVIPNSSFKKEAEHIKGFEQEVFWVTRAGEHELEEPMLLRPTSETAMYPMYALWIRSYKDLPLKLYQNGSVYRYETKATKPLLRGREFLWIEAHDVHRTENDALKQVHEDMRIAEKVLYEELGLPFLLLQREEFDKFAGAVTTNAFEVLFPDKEVVQIATTHYLGTNFSKPFNITYLDEKGVAKHPHQTCYGPGISRIAASVICIHGDDYGLILPFEAAPIQVIIVPIPIKQAVKDVLAKCRELEKDLVKAGLRIKLDDSDATPGEKFYKWELLGVPVRLEVGPKELAEGAVTVFRRDTRERFKVKNEDLIKNILDLKEKLLKALRDKAEKFLNENMHKAETKHELIKIAKEKGGIIRVNYCGNNECADLIKAETGGFEVRGKRIDVNEIPDGPCVWCGEKAERVVYVAKAY